MMLVTVSSEMAVPELAEKSSSERFLRLKVRDLTTSSEGIPLQASSYVSTTTRPDLNGPLPNTIVIETAM